jgi:hypothetical protein
MHIVGLLGMERRVYTYPSGLGWTAYNLAETIGGFITAAGILVLFANLVVSYRRGEDAGPDPWHGATLEWTTSSPPPEYNYAVIPVVRSAYPNWDLDDRERDREHLAAGTRTLERGHEQPVTTPVEGDWIDTAQMPHGSPWPILLAVAAAMLAVTLLIGQFIGAAAALALVLVILVGWHWREPREEAA